MQVGSKGGLGLSGWLTWRNAQRWRCFSLGRSAKAPSQWHARIASPRTVDWTDPFPSLPAVGLPETTHNTVRWRKGLAAVQPHWTSRVQLWFQVTNWFMDTWKQNILCGKPQFLSRKLFWFGCFYNLAKWHKTHSTGWLQICACIVMHKCNLFKLALHAEPLDCRVEAQLHAVITLSLWNTRPRTRFIRRKAL